MGCRTPRYRPGRGETLTDFVVIGGGIAGVAAAANLAPHGEVTLLEMESSLAFHTTGRSAALFTINYGGPGSRPLSHASQSFFNAPPEGSTDGPLLHDRGNLWVAKPDQMDHLDEIAREGVASGAGSQTVSPQEAVALAPMLRMETLGGGIYEPSAKDIDVAGLHQAFVRILRRQDGQIETTSPATSIAPMGTGWRVTTPKSKIDCGAVINAAGAWGDRVAEMAGVQPIGLRAMRRTAFMVPGSAEISGAPMVANVDHDYYFRPDGVQLLCSLAEEIPDEPSDVRPRMEDVALAIERINEVTNLSIRTVNSQWTGLRTFAPDRDFVIGEEPDAPGFFWLVGQGGTGIMTSPAYGSLIASLVTGSELAPELRSAEVDPEVTSPNRFRR